jgi:hypothetical protein
MVKRHVRQTLNLTSWRRERNIPLLSMLMLKMRIIKQTRKPMLFKVVVTNKSKLSQLSARRLCR